MSIVGSSFVVSVFRRFEFEAIKYWGLADSVRGPR